MSLRKLFSSSYWLMIVSAMALPQNSVAATWTGATSDINNASNWGGTLPANNEMGLFTDVGNKNPVLTANFNAGSLAMGEAANSNYTVTGPFVLTMGGVGISGNTINASNFDFTVDVNQLDLSRSGAIVSGDYIAVNDPPVRGTGDITIGHSGGTMILRMGVTTNNASTTPSIQAFNGTSVTIYPKVDLTASTTTNGTNREFRVSPTNGSTISLLGGIASTATTSPGRSFKTLGEAGGLVTLGSSPGWTGRVNIVSSDLRITASDSLGVSGASGSYTEILSGTNTGALQLANGISSSEEIFVYDRTTTANPHIRNFSGANTLSGTIQNDVPAPAVPAPTGFCMISSDGTAAGDSLTIAGNILRTSVAGGGVSNLWLMGAGNGTVTGQIVQTGTNNQWSEVRKTGAGTWTISGNANTYSGTTVVSQGVLQIGSTGNINSTSGVTIDGGEFKYNSSTALTKAITFTAGTISGTGAINVPVTVGTGATLSPGNSPGSQAYGSGLTWTGSGDYNWQIFDVTGAAGTGYDLLEITGALDVSAASAFDINLWSLSSIGPDVNGDAIGWDNTIPYSWVLATTTGGVTGFDASNFLINTGANNGTGGFSNDLGGGSLALGVVGNNLVLTFTPVPEPNSIILGSIGMIGLSFMARYSRRSRR